jgi:hypothetical protein
MAFLTVTEFAAPFVDIDRGLPMMLGPKTAQNNVAIAAGSAQSNAFAATTRAIRVETDSICCVEVGGTNPVAIAVGATGTSRMVAGQTEYYYVKPGEKIAVILST